MDPLSISLGFILLSVSIPTPSFGLQNSEVDSMKREIANAMIQWQENGRHPLIAGAVRLGFHDCVGGCDGCINHDVADNAGLKRYSDALDRVYSQYSNTVSRADFYALAAITALDLAQQADGRDSGQHSVRFRSGRQDCSGSPRTDSLRRFPKATDGLIASTNFFQDEFGMNTQDTVALLGAHTLGRVHFENSGFSNSEWVQNSDQLSNDYYRELGGREWNSETSFVDDGPLRGEHNFWATGPGNDRIMMNVDMSLLLDFGADSNPNGRPRCNFQSCPRSLTYDLVETYAVDNGRWLRDFSSAFQRVLDHGSTNLQEPTGLGGGVVPVPGGGSIVTAGGVNGDGRRGRPPPEEGRGRGGLRGGGGPPPGRRGPPLGGRDLGDGGRGGPRGGKGRPRFRRNALVNLNEY